MLVESYRENFAGSTTVTMGSPELGWPSTEVPVGGGAIVFAGGTRPLDFAALQVVTTDGQKQVVSMLSSEQVIASGGHWELRLTLAMHAKNVFITDLREFLPPVETGYLIGDEDDLFSLIVGVARHDLVRADDAPVASSIPTTRIESCSKSTGGFGQWWRFRLTTTRVSSGGSSHERSSGSDARLVRSTRTSRRFVANCQMAAS